MRAGPWMSYETLREIVRLDTKSGGSKPVAIERARGGEARFLYEMPDSTTREEMDGWHEPGALPEFAALPESLEE